MSQKMLKFVFVIILLGSWSGCNVLGGPSDPEPRTEDWWVYWHDQFKHESASNPNIPILFYGDSITAGWREEGASVFAEYYEPIGVANYALGGDRTEHVLWRILDGEIDGLSPKVIVLKIGINNLGGASNRDIAGGVTTIVATLRQRLPNTKILLLGVLPAGSEWAYDNVVELNSYIRELHDGSSVYFLDMFASFVSDTWGEVPLEYFHDGVHLTTAGYRKWADVMNPLFNQLIA